MTLSLCQQQARLPPLLLRRRPERARRGGSPIAFELSEAVAVAEHAAELSGEIIRGYFRLAPETEQKADASPVTIADRKAERAMRGTIAAAFPAHGILGEEGGGDRKDAPYLWVLDPIDGTRAFITGRPIFGTLIALLHEGVPVLGVIDQPVTGERWIGLAGRPTRFRGRFGGIPRSRTCLELKAAELSCTTPEMLGASRPAWQRLADRVGRVSWGGDCYAYGLLALGCIDIIAECDLKTWDWAALVPVIEGAGGRMTDWDGGTLRPGCDGRVLAVGDPALLAQAVALLAAQPA